MNLRPGAIVVGPTGRRFKVVRYVRREVDLDTFHLQSVEHGVIMPVHYNHEILSMLDYHVEV